MANKIQIKRTSVSGRTPNTTNSGNGQYIDSGEFALNLADGILYSSNGSLIPIGANNVNVNVSNSINIGNSTSFVFANSTIIGGNSYNNPALFAPNINDPYWSFGSQANSTDFFMQTRFWGGGDIHHGFRILDTNGNTVPFKVDGTGAVYLNKIVANGSLGTSGQVLTSNSIGVYWSTVSGGGGGSVNVDAQYIWTNTQTFNANVFIGNTSTTSFTVNTESVYVNTDYGFIVGEDFLTGNTWTKIYPGKIFATSNNGAISQVTTYNNTAVSKIEIRRSGGDSSSPTDLSIGNEIGRIDFVPHSSGWGNFSSGPPVTAAIVGEVSSSLSSIFTGEPYADIVFKLGDGFIFDAEKLRITANSINIANTIGISANGSLGTAGQTLTSNGSAVYWSNGFSESANYTFSGVHTYTSNIVFDSSFYTPAIIAGGSAGSPGQSLKSDGYTVYWGDSFSENAYYNFTNVHTHSANLEIQSTAGLIANGSAGSPGEVLTSDGTTVYWSTVTGGGGGSVNVDSQYVWTNTQTFQNTITFSSIIDGTANNTAYVGSVTAANVVSNAQLQANLGNYQTTAGLSANVATLTSNNSVYFDGRSSSYFSNASNINTGTLPYSQLGPNVVNTTSNFSLSGVITLNSNVVFNASVVDSTGNTGTTGQILTTNGANTYWSSKYYVGSLPPTYPNYGDTWYYTDMEKLFMWINDGGSDYWYDFLPPA